MMNIKQQYKIAQYRYGFVLGFVALLVLGFCFRLTQLHVIDKQFLQEQGNARTLRVVNIPAYRGMITDRYGEPLAVSTPVSSVWLNPSEWDETHPAVSHLGRIIPHVSLKEIQEKVTKYAGREFVYLARHVSPQVADTLKQLQVPGVHLKTEYRRFYPAGEVVSQVLGFTDIDDKGQEGVELAYDNWLRGRVGKKRIMKDRLGRQIEDIGSVSESYAGQDIELSLDSRLQYLAYRELKKAVVQHQAKSGSAVVLDIKTGEVLAMVNQPSYNPNARHKEVDNIGLRNRAVTHYFEPASAIKAFSMASVLAHGKITPATMVDTSPGRMKIKGGVVRDIRNYGMISVSRIMEKSSNIGISKLVLNLPQDNLWRTYQQFGFGTPTGSGFPGESGGYLDRPHDNHPFTVATMAFGYGIAVTPLQLARAYAILGAGGVKRPVSFLKVTGQTEGERVMSSDVCRKVVEMLAGVTAQKGSKAGVDGYLVAGKTGTSRKVGKDGYEKGRHRAVFGGLAPAVSPKFAIVVTVDEPSQGQYYGNQVAAPVFSRIAAGALRLFNIPPDLMDTQGVRVAHVGNNHS